MVDNEVSAATITKLTKSKQPVSSLRKTRKNQSRRLRRKKSKRRFLKQLAKLRVARISDELCESVQVFDISTGMECATPLKDVAEWQNQHQLAYWKSRAISLEYENKMLHQHIREMYVKQFEAVEEFEPVEEDQDMKQTQPREKMVDELSKAPEEAPGEGKRRQMTELYGDMAPKINGIETAVQLNYDYQLGTTGKIPYWPNLPINL